MFDRFARGVSKAAGSRWSFALAVLAVIVWGLLGPRYGYSDTWQMVINTGTTIVTFWMVFLIQNSQNRDGAAIQAKLDEILRAIPEARNDLIAAEERTETEIEKLKVNAEIARLKQE